jgi:xanthine dehydrogenase YagS FAD-binding subunit
MSLPSTVEEVITAVAAAGGELRAGGVDVMVRRGLGRSAGPFVDLRGVTGLRGVSWRPDGSARIGAMTTIAEIAADERLVAAYPALTLTAGALATPEIRAAATLGGNLLQRNHCWYYRNPGFSCHQTGGTTCPARSGAHLYAAVIDQGPCVAPHPSSMAVALLGYDATVEIHGSGTVAVRDLYGDGSDPTRDHLLQSGEVLGSVALPVPVSGERVAHHRAGGRSEAEWPLVEAIARLVVADEAIVSVAVAVGGVARTPLRLTEVEAALVSRPPSREIIETAAAHATSRCAPLRQTGYKVGLLRDVTVEVLERAAGLD